MYLYQIVNGIYISYKDSLEASNYQEHLPKHIVMLFQNFKRAYDNRNIIKLSEIISEDFSGDIYGENKKSFLKTMNSIFNYYNAFLNPKLIIQINSISENTKNKFVCVLELDIKLNVLNIPLPFILDNSKLICEAQPEGNFNYWMITKISKFQLFRD